MTSQAKTYYAKSLSNHMNASGSQVLQSWFAQDCAYQEQDEPLDLVAEDCVCFGENCSRIDFQPDNTLVPFWTLFSSGQAGATIWSPKRRLD
ncbi:MAG TPA: hypothetical protein V6D17_22705 [Candidatus Obscuribacterales bacterium]